MTAPDPGLTDLIAAHKTRLGGVLCECGWIGGPGEWAAHVALVVEQHTNGRIAELEAERDRAIAHDRQPYPTAWAYEQACAALERHRKRADKHEATVARVEAEAALLERMIRTAPWSRYTEVRRSHLRSLCAALEGPGEAG